MPLPDGQIIHAVNARNVRDRFVNKLIFVVHRRLSVLLRVIVVEFLFDSAKQSQFATAAQSVCWLVLLQL